MAGIDAVVARERGAVSAHRAALRGAALPPPAEAPRGTFLHGFLLPFSLIAATLRDGELRRPYVRLTAARLAAVAALTALAMPGIPRSHDSPNDGHDLRVVIHHDEPHADAPSPSSSGLHVDAPGVKIDIPAGAREGKLEVLGVSVPVVEEGSGAAREQKATEGSPEAPTPARLAKLTDGVNRWWRFLLALFAVLSGASTIVVALSRRYDDWLSHGASKLAAIAPEETAPKTPTIALDLKWLYKKLYRRARGYVVFAAGVPALAVLLLVPAVGHYVFQAALLAWGWYWLGVFTAAKSAHAWADEGNAPSPAVIRALNDHVPTHALTAPVRAYGSAWARLTRGLDPPAATFERTPAAFLGLALARAILALPGLYLFARPLVPVAAGRLVAEGDPQHRFARGAEPPAEDQPKAA